MALRLGTRDRRIGAPGAFWGPTGPLGQARGQSMGTRGLPRARKISALLAHSDNPEITLMASRKSQILMFGTRTGSRAHSVSFSTIHHQHHSNLYGAIGKFGSTISQGGFSLRLSHEIRIATVGGPSGGLMGTFRVPSRYSATIIALSHAGFWRPAPSMRANGSLAPSRAGQAFWILGPSAPGWPRGPQQKKTFC